MNRWLNLVMCGCIGWGVLGEEAANGQAVSRERDVSITGPGGRTIERRTSVERSPGHVDRQLQISRPGGTLERSVHASAGPAFRGGPGFRPGPGPRFGPPPPWYGPPRSGPGVWPAVSFGLGALTGAAIAAPIARATAPSVVVVDQPAFVAAPAVIAAPPTVVVEQPAVIDPLDPVALAAQRLQSVHGGTRREGAQSLGLLGDPRGVPPLVDALKNDWNTSVRVAAAESLGQIGGPEAEAVLGRCVVYEKKDSVRDAAAQALQVARARDAAIAASAPPVATETVIESRVEPLPRTASAAPRRVVPKPPAPAPARPSAWRPKVQAETPSQAIPLEGPDDQDSAAPAAGDRVPPPPPSPVPG
ncbi:HEAT repeat domain-containing protein [Paludisphaera mucosa]|uniref:HEAT repeat domain-containing protein n=1 Tax=Paludisphaera mucosa TaxID=3030827 RepID=A0ABT6FHF6_9BACT|nr:HEAT repeat domain-containing protein [Paludisphaera mucosa]MDG3007002.1 HEAT repeat domain-containing protein [Paludisphaera mucosa]